MALALMFILTSAQAQTDTYDFTPESGMDFNKLFVKGVVNVQLMHGDEARVWVELEDGMEAEKVQKNIEFNYDAENKEVYLKTSPMKGWQGKVYVQYQQLGEIKAATAVDVRSKDTIRGGRLEIDASGASQLNLKVDVKELDTETSGASTLKIAGYAENHSIESSGASNVHARKLITKNLVIEASGASDVNVLVTNSVKGTLEGSASLTNKTKAKTSEVETEGAAHYGATGDTTSFVFGKSKVIIIDDDVDIDLDDDISKARKKEKKFNGHWGGFELGFNGFLNTDNKMELPAKYNFLELKEEKSILVNLNLFEKNFNLIRNHVGVVTGLGLQYNNYRFVNNMILTNDSAEIFGSYDTDQAKNYIKSKLVVNYVTVPLILEYTTHGKHEFHIGAGAQFAYKIGEHTKVVYEQGTDKKKSKDRGDFYLNPYKLELTGRIGWGWVKLFATYSITPMFEDNKGPELYPFTAGITVVGW